MTYLPKALYLTIDEATKTILAIPKVGFKPNPNTRRVWDPIGGTWHNTGNPSLGLWGQYSPSQRLAWGDNLNRYYRSMGWHSGPHWCGGPGKLVIQLCDLLADGIHASCYNGDHFGSETLGNFAHGGDDPTKGQGLEAMESTAAVWAATCIRFGWDPRKAINFHRSCLADHHACPGDLVSDEFAWGLVEARIKVVQAPSNVQPAAPPPEPDTLDPDDFELA